MSQVVTEVPAELNETLSRRAGERGETLEEFALVCLRVGADQLAAQPVATDEVVCSFCRRTRDEVRHMVTGRNARICGECVAECRRLLERGEREARGEAAP